ncbi:unnamed protein product, partial [marine sediment metagenome]
ANVSADWIFPTDNEVDLGLDGGDGIGRNATGALPVGDVSNIGDQTIYVGGVNVVFGPQTDRGDSNPSDQEFVAQSLHIDTTLADIIVTIKPNLNLLLNYAEDVELPELPDDLKAPISIILEDTLVFSKYLNGSVGTLSDILTLDEENDDLAIRTDAKFKGTNEEDCQIAPFHFKYDTDGEIWGAGTAFLREDAETPPVPPTSENCIDGKK